MALGIPLGKHRSIHLGKHKAIVKRRVHDPAMLGGGSVTIDSRTRGYGAGTAYRPMHQTSSKKKPLKFKF